MNTVRQLTAQRYSPAHASYAACADAVAERRTFTQIMYVDGRLYHDQNRGIWTEAPMTTAQRIHALFNEQAMKAAAQAECVNSVCDDWGNETFLFADASVLDIMVSGIHRYTA